MISDLDQALGSRYFLSDANERTKLIYSVFHITRHQPIA